MTKTKRLSRYLKGLHNGTLPTHPPIKNNLLPGYKKIKGSYEVSLDEKNKVIEKYLNGDKYKDVAKSLNLTTCRVYKILKENKVLRTRTEALKKWHFEKYKDKWQVIIDGYHNGLTHAQIAKSLNISPDTVSSFLTHKGLKRNKSVNQVIINDEIIDYICASYKKGYSVVKLASDHHKSVSTVKKILIGAGVSLRTQAERDILSLQNRIREQKRDWKRKNQARFRKYPELSREEIARMNVKKRYQSDTLEK